MNDFFESSPAFLNTPKAIYFINTYDVIMYKMDSLGDIKRQLFERIDFQKYLSPSDISEYQLFLDDVIKCQDIFNLMGIDINTKGLKRKYNIFKAYQVIICCIAEMYISKNVNTPTYRNIRFALYDFILCEPYMSQDTPYKHLLDYYRIKDVIKKENAELALSSHIHRIYLLHNLFKKYNVYERMEEE